MEADRSQKDMATHVIEVAELNSEVRRDLRGRQMPSDHIYYPYYGNHEAVCERQRKRLLSEQNVPVVQRLP